MTMISAVIIGVNSGIIAAYGLIELQECWKNRRTKKDGL